MHSRESPPLIIAWQRPILAAIVVVTVVLAFFSLRVDLNQRPDELLYKDDPGYPQLKAFFEQFGYDEVVVGVYSAENVLEKLHLERVRRITERLEDIEGVTRVVSLGNAQDVFARDGTIEVARLLRNLPQTLEAQNALVHQIEQNPLYKNLLVSRDRKNTLFDITLDARLSESERDRVLAEINAAFSGAGGGSVYYLAGSPIGRSEVFRVLRRDFSTLLPIGMVLLVVSMYLVFRHYLCVLLPFVAVSLSVVWTVGFMYLAGSELNFLSAMIPTILFVCGTADCIHILSQYQDCRHTCKTKTEALRQTVRLMALPCFLTTVTTMVGFASLAATRLAPLRLFGLFTAVGMGFAFVLAMTILPIGLNMADTKGLSAGPPPYQALAGVLRRLARFVQARPFLILAVAGLALVLGAYGTKKLHVETDPGKFVTRSRVISDMHYIEREVGGFIPFFVVVESHRPDRMKDPALLEKIDALSEFLRSQEGVDQVVSAADLVKYLNFRFHDSDPAEYRIPADSSAVAELLLAAGLSDGDGLLARFFDPAFSATPVAIRFRYHDFYHYSRLMGAVLPYVKREFGPVPEVRTYATGTNMMLANTFLPILHGFRQSLFVAALAILAIMVALFRSFRMALLCMVPNLIPILITLGTMGVFGISLNFMTVPIAAIALGLAVDDTIHFLSRFRLELRKDGSYPAAIERTLESTGKPIIITSVILVVGFLIFLFSDFQYTRNLGMLISFTMASAILGDLLVLPALLLVFKPVGRKAVVSPPEKVL